MPKIDQWFLLLLTNPVVFDHYSAQIFKKGACRSTGIFFAALRADGSPVDWPVC